MEQLPVPPVSSTVGPTRRGPAAKPNRHCQIPQNLVHSAKLCTISCGISLDSSALQQAPDLLRLFFNDLQNLHGAALHADATGNALACRAAGNGRGNDDMEGADLRAFSAARAELFVDHVHTRLGILGNGASLTGFGALAALDAGQRLRSPVSSPPPGCMPCPDETPCRRPGTSPDTLQTCHAGGSFFDRNFLHCQSPSLFFNGSIIQGSVRNSNPDSDFSRVKFTALFRSLPFLFQQISREPAFP